MNKKVGILIAISALAVVMLFIGFTNPTGKAALAGSDAVRIGYQPYIFAQPLFVALEKGYFEEAGLKYELYRFESPIPMINAVVSNKLDFAAQAPTTTLLAAEEKTEKQDFKIYFVNMDSKENPITFLLIGENSEIRSLADLKGKKIGVSPENIQSRVSTKLLLKPYMKENEINFVDISPALQSQALASGEVDALFALEPIATISIEKVNAKVLYSAPQTSLLDGKPLIGGTIFASAKFVETRPENARKLKAVLDKAIDFIRKNPEEAKLILTKYTPLTKDIALKVHQPIFLSSTEIDKELMQEQADVLLREKLLEIGLDTSNLYYK